MLYKNIHFKNIVTYQWRCGHWSNIQTTSCESTLYIFLSQRSFFPRWSLSYPSEFNIDHEISLPQAPDKSCIHRSLLIWSPRLNVFCRRLDTCTTSSWWASGERRRWRCLTTTWRTCSTARTRRTQVRICQSEGFVPSWEWATESFTNRCGACVNDGVRLTRVCWNERHQSSPLEGRKVLMSTSGCQQQKNSTCTSLPTYHNYHISPQWSPEINSWGEQKHSRSALHVMPTLCALAF